MGSYTPTAIFQGNDNQYSPERFSYYFIYNERTGMRLNPLRGGVLGIVLQYVTF
jgi:hypothetical protein